MIEGESKSSISGRKKRFFLFKKVLRSKEECANNLQEVGMKRVQQYLNKHDKVTL